jgi:hypothetical protein
MPTQVITIRPDGGIFGLQHKRGQGLDLRKLGHAEIKRATLVEWDGNKQAWFIRWCSEDALLDGLSWDFETFQEAEVDYTAFGGNAIPESEDDLFCVFGDVVIYFPDYEDAVAAEVAVIQALQVRGELVA